jgi:hypothetical protein
VAGFPLPPSPERLRGLIDDDDVVAVAPFTALARIYRAGGDHPARWDEFREHGPVASARFDPHPPTPDGRPRRDPAAAVLYAAASLQTCVAEVFQAARVVDRLTGRPHLSVWRPARTLRLLDLAGTWPTRAGASQAISSGPRQRARAWARAIRSARPDLDGLWYRSAMDAGEPAVCLWTPARGALPAAPLVNRELVSPALELPLGRAARAVGYRLL